MGAFRPDFVKLIHTQYLFVRSSLIKWYVGIRRQESIVFGR